MSERELIVRADEVEIFLTPETEGIYESQCLIDQEAVGSKDLNVNRGTLKAGKRLQGGSHPVDSDECYYVLRGRARLALGGDPESGEGSTVHEIGPDTAIFIPGAPFTPSTTPTTRTW